MGNIHCLEKFCISNNAIAEEIDIRDEIAKWLREHGENPTIIIDVKELNRVLSNQQLLHSFASVLNLGGQFWKFNEILDYFFGEMKKAGANLVFIARLKESQFQDINKWESLHLNPSERLLYNLMQICSKYGQLSVNYGLGESSILAYARQHRDQVMALITRNTPFLVYDIDFSYWCLANVNFYDLKILDISPKQMLRTLALNSKQMQLVFVLSELKTNIKLNLVGKQCHKQSRMVQFVKSLKYGENGFDLDQLAHKLKKKERDDLEDKLNRVFAVNEYAGNWNDDIYEGLILDLANNDESFNLVLQFCKGNLYFAYKLINEKDSTQKDLLCIEERREEDATFRSLMVTIMLKMCGILFKDVDPKKRPTIRNNRNFGDIYVTSAKDIIYPTMPLPSLKELLVEEDNKRFDDSRWSLFKWLIGLEEESISDIRSSNDSKFIRIVSLTLTFLQSHKIISAHEANTIRQMEMERNIKTELDLPRGTTSPSKLNQRIPNINGAWVQTAQKYTIAYEIICHCLEVPGLRKETAPILFDAPEFNARMQRMESDSKPHKMLKMDNFGL